MANTEYNAAMALLAKHGLNDSVSGWIDYLPAQLGRLRQQVRLVATGIQDDDDFAFYSLDGDEAADPRAARTAIIELITDWQYKKTTGVTKMAGLVAVSQSTFDAANHLNHFKREWQAVHIAMRQVAGRTSDGEFDTKQASDTMRNVLKRISEGGLCLDTTDRRIPLIPGPPLTVNWFTLTSAPSERKTMGHVLDDIQKFIDEAQEKGYEEQESLYRAEYARLSSQPRDKPVSFCSRKPITSVRFRASYVLHKQRKSMSHYAASPILFLQADPPITPKLSVFDPKMTGDKVGPKRKRSKDKVSLLKRLPHYYYYLADSQPVKAKPKPMKQKNPYSATAFPGMWLGTRKTKSGALNATLLIQLNDRSQRRVSIAKMGITAAWAEGAKIYSADRDVSLDAILARCPTDQNVRDMLTWADAMG